MNNIRIRRLMAVLSLFAGAGFFAVTGFAQATTTTTATPTTEQVTTGTPAPAVNQAPEVLEKYVVTGSNIPNAADALAIPVSTIDLQTIADSGISSDTLDL